MPKKEKTCLFCKYTWMCRVDTPKECPQCKRRIRVKQYVPSVTLEERLMLSVAKGANCWEWQGARQNRGYGVFVHHGIHYLVHRLSYTLYKGHIPEGLCVCHTFDNRICVNPDHLWVGTQADNNYDMINKKRHYVLPPKSKLTVEDVKEIRIMYSPYACTYKSISEKYQISESCVHRIVKRLSWKNLT